MSQVNRAHESEGHSEVKAALGLTVVKLTLSDVNIFCSDNISVPIIQKFTTYS